MKFFVAFAALVAVAVAFPNKPAFSEEAEIAAIIAAIHSPNTDPATAALLEQQLEAILNGGNPAVPEPIIIGPAIIDQNPIAIGPEIIDFPLPDGGAATAPVVPGAVDGPIVPSPVVIGPIAPGQPAPLVQLIVNVNGSPLPIAINDVAPEPVQVVDEAPVVVDPVQIVDVMPVVDPVQVVDVVPVVVEPVQIGTPILPSPAVNLPDELN